MDATERIKELLKQRGWTAYKLSKQSGLAESTVNNILKRNTVPSVTTLESICGGFGMTMAQFFAVCYDVRIYLRRIWYDNGSILRGR